MALTPKERRAEYQANNKDKVKIWQANYIAKKKLEDAKMGKISKAAGRVAETFPYKGDKLTIKQAVALPECKYSRVSVSNKINAGLTLEEIIHPQTKEEKDAAQKLNRAEAAKQRTLDKITIKDAKADIKRQAAIKIMSVPVHPMKTAVYWIMKNYTYTADSNMEPIQLRPNGGY